MSIFIEVESEALRNPKLPSVGSTFINNKYWFSDDGRVIYVFSGHDTVIQTQQPELFIYKIPFG
jgi:hypothetical protein